MTESLDVVGSHRRHSSISAVAAPLPKKLILCCDGTWMDSDNGWVKGKSGSAGKPQNPSNVTRIARAIKDQDQGHHQQIVYYQAGVGTGLGLYDHLVGGGTGAGLSENIREAYSFLASNYSQHDELRKPDSIFLIGFSRGAFTARSIGGFIGAIGVLRRRAMPYFYEIFQDWVHAGDPSHPPQFFRAWCKQNPDYGGSIPSDALAGDKESISDYLKAYRIFLEFNHLTTNANIKCIGVWDTVGSLGIPINPILGRLLPFLPPYFREYKWFDTTIDNHVENAFQALGLDERRFPYSPAVWERPDGCTTNLKQVWFAGAHSNVGGSYADQGMADITLMWMMDQLSGNTSTKDIKEALDWIAFDEHYVHDYYRLQVQEYQRPSDTTRLLPKSLSSTSNPGWAKGKIYDSLTFPQSLAGSRVRQPGRYRRTSPTTGSETTELMRNTHEYVHASVRYRIDAGGKGVESDWSQAFPHGLTFEPWIQAAYRRIRTSMRPWTYRPDTSKGPLCDWRLEDGHVDHREPNGVDERAGKPARWIYTGHDHVDKTWMDEDVMGEFERSLKDKDPSVARKLEVSGEGVVGKITRHLHPKTM